MKGNLSGKEGRRDGGWKNGRNKKRLWEPRKPNRKIETSSARDGVSALWEKVPEQERE